MAVVSIKNKLKSGSLLVGNAAYDPAAFVSIATITPSGVTTASFNSIPSTYQHLQIRGIYQGSALDWLGIRANGISTNSYSMHRLNGDGATATADALTSDNRIDRIMETPTSTTTSVWGVVIIDVHDYASTTKNKTFRIFSGYDKNGTGRIQLGSGAFLSTNAVDSITLITGGQTFNSGTQFALYGIKGA